MAKTQLPSQTIRAFLTFMENSKEEYDACLEDVEKRSKLNIDYLHDIELSKDRNERNRIATKIQRNQIERRISKDNSLLLEGIAKFYSEQSNKVFLKRLSQIIRDQKTIEAYVSSPRNYQRRAGDEK